jgi:cohesin loading factor subunit SCC2
MVETPAGMVGLATETPMPTAMPQQVDPATLRVLATAAASLMMLWEARTYLRRLYNVSSHTKDKEGKPAAKELNKAANKVHGIPGERFWEAIARNMTTLDSQEAMLAKCREFSTLLAIDEEFKVDRGDDADGDLDAIGEVDDMLATPGGARPPKRKSSVSSTGFNKRPKSRKDSVGRKRSSPEPDEPWD